MEIFCASKYPCIAQHHFFSRNNSSFFFVYSLAFSAVFRPHQLDISVFSTKNRIVKKKKNVNTVVVQSFLAVGVHNVCEANALCRYCVCAISTLTILNDGFVFLVETRNPCGTRVSNPGSIFQSRDFGIEKRKSQNPGINPGIGSQQENR